MNKTSINTFIKGMNKDADKSVLSNNSYLHAENFRIVTSEGSSTGALENIKGNKWIASTGLLPEDQLICGSVRLRDYIIIFSTTNTGTPVHGVGRSMIHKLVLDKATEDVDSIIVLYDDNLNSGTGSDTLDFSTANRIKAISRYETPNIQKVYWTDGYNNLRYLDAGKNLTITGGAYTVNDYMSTAMFEFLPAFTPSKPVLSDIVSGNLMSGMVQYSYQLYRLNGAETAFSPVSEMIHLVSDNDFSSNTLSYSGDSESVETGKGLKLSITYNDSGYNRLRLIRIHYTTLNSIPVISVATEIEINTTAGTVEVVDTGETVNSLTLDEFNISSTELFKCEDIASKDNRLFAANIEKSEFIVDDTWDARAVRFISEADSQAVYAVPSHAWLGDSIPANNISITVPTDLNDPIEWDNAGWDNYVPTHDGLNIFNDTDNDGVQGAQYKYQANGSIIGAEGPNIKIDFSTEGIILDSSNDDTTFHATTPTDTIDISYTNYASPWKGDKLSWQRDEIYRLSVVFGNDRGQKSEPQWICDLRMPSLHDTMFANSDAEDVFPYVLASDNGSGVIYTARLYPRIYFKSFPSNATWAQIYRVKRERADRSVVSQCIAVPTRDAGAYWPNTMDQANLSTDGAEIIKLVSPEINITKNISYRANDYLEYVTHFNGVNGTARTISATDGFNRHTYKYLINTRVAFSNNTKTDINEASVISPRVDPTDGITLDGKFYINFNNNGTDAKGCSGLLVSYDNIAWSAEATTYAIVNYKSNVYGSQYGGNTYESRQGNIYTSCSDIIDTINIWNDIDGGDTFINYFDVSTVLYDTTQVGLNLSFSEVVYAPLESSINCDLRHDKDCQHITYLNTHSALRQEYSGDQVMSNGMIDITYTQLNDLYLYNTVYSQESSVQLAVTPFIDTPNETVFDCLVKASNIKFNGELSDSWTKFNINEEIEVDANYGPIRALNTVNDKLLYWQEDAFGILSVNVRSLIQDNSSAQLALGTGGVLDRYDYISSTIGILDKFAIVNSNSSAYWFYDKETSIYKFDNQLSNLTKDKGMWSWFKTNYSNLYSVHGVYDRPYNEVIFTLYKSDKTGYTIAFNEQTDQFTSFYSFVPRLYIDYKDGYLSVRDYVVAAKNYSYAFMHNSNINPRSRFYSLLAYNTADPTNTYASTIKLLHNEEYGITKVYDNIYYISNSYNESSDIEQYNITFDKVRCYNDYQNTNWVTLSYPTNIMRRERGWSLVIPRNLVDDNYSTSPNIFTDLAATKTWSERIRDKYMVLDLSFNNTTYTRFVVPYIGIKYRLSYR